VANSRKVPPDPECQKDLGIKFNLEPVDGLTIQARVTSAVQSGSGPDIICAFNNWAQLYADSVADVSDVAEEIGKAQGGFYETSRAIANDGSKWIAVPWTIIGLQIVNRKSWWGEIGYDAAKYPQTWDEYREAGKKLKAKGHPIGQTLGHAFGDGPAFWYPYLWSWGGKEVEADGKTVVLNSPGTNRVGQIRGRALEGCLRRRGLRLGRFRQQSRLSRRHDQCHQQRRLNLSRSQEKAR